MLHKYSFLVVLLVSCLFSVLLSFSATISEALLLQQQKQQQQQQNLTNSARYLLVIPRSIPENNDTSHFRVINLTSTTEEKYYFDPEKYDVLADARYDEKLFQLGWNFLSIDASSALRNNINITSKRSNSKKSSSGGVKEEEEEEVKTTTRRNLTTQEEFLAVGFLEGYLSWKVMSQVPVVGVWNQLTQISSGISKWLNDHVNYIRKNARESISSSSSSSSQEEKHSSNRIWKHVAALLEQLEGIAQGYNLRQQQQQQSNNDKNASSMINNLTSLDIFGVNFGPEIADVMNHFFFLSEEEEKEGKREEVQQALEFILRRGVLLAQNPQHQKESKRNQRRQHCSAVCAFTKNTKYNSSKQVDEKDQDFFCGHSTWSSMSNGLFRRIYKTYRFSSSSSSKKEKQEEDVVSISASSYPGLIISEDDFYSSLLVGPVEKEKEQNKKKNVKVKGGITMVSTTLSLYNNSLYSKFPSSCISEFLRASSANFLATVADDQQKNSSSSSPQVWSEVFAFNNSGTYNNQVLIVSLSKMNQILFPSSSPKSHQQQQQQQQQQQEEEEQEERKGVIFMLEQLPNYVEYQDQTTDLLQNRYVASYNIASFNKTRQLSGTDQQEKLYGNFFSFQKYARAEIFRRDAPNVLPLQTMNLMRYNDYKHDKLSLIQNCSSCPGHTCSPLEYSSQLSIANRADVMPATTASSCYGGVGSNSLGRAFFAAIDSKVALFSTFYKNATCEATIVSGPTHGGKSNIPVFSFSTTYDKKKFKRCDGCPDCYDFPFVAVVPPLVLNPEKVVIIIPNDNGNNGGEKPATLAGKIVGGILITCAFFIIVLVVKLLFFSGGGKKHGENDGGENGDGDYKNISS